LVHNSKQLHPAFLKLWTSEPAHTVTPCHVLLQNLEVWEPATQ